MTRYVLLSSPGHTVLSDTPFLRAAEAERVGTMAALLTELDGARAELPGEREAARREAAAAGREAGLAAGREEARAETARAVTAALGEARRHRRAVAEEAAELALAIVRRLVPSVAGDAMLPSLVEGALAELQEDEPLTVRVHPAEAAALRRSLEGTGVAVAGDESLPRGAAVIDTRAGTADASLDARLDVIREGLRG